MPKGIKRNRNPDHKSGLPPRSVADMEVPIDGLYDQIGNDVKNKQVGSDQFQTGKEDLGTYVISLFDEFKVSRQPWVDMWKEAIYNYLGQYQPETTWRQQTEGVGNKSRAFVKITTLKCNTAHAKIMDLATGPLGEDIPFDGIPIRTKAHDVMQVTDEDLKKSCEVMKKKIKGHFKRIDLVEEMDTGNLERTILGTAVIKGPINMEQEVKDIEPVMISGMPIQQLDPTAKPFNIKRRKEAMPTFVHIPLWEYYIDCNAKNRKDSIGEIHFTRLLPDDFRALGENNGYDEEAVNLAAEHADESYDLTSDERPIQLADTYTGTQGEKDRRVSHIEFWGKVPVKKLRDAGCKNIPKDKKDNESIEALIVVASDGVVVKQCVNPLNGRRPFNVCPYRKIPFFIFGFGVPWLMRDSQKMINSLTRMMIDNKALSGPGVFAVNKDKINTKLTKNMDIYPGKTFYIKGSARPEDAVKEYKFQDNTRELLEYRRDFERLADEESGIPKFEQGEQSSFLNKTAAGMSMILSRSNLNLKPPVKNMDDYWVEPIVEATYDWFMEMADDTGAMVPMTIRATGTSELIARELKMENYAKFMQVTQAPQDAIFTDRVKMIKNWAKMLETEDVMQSDEQIEVIMQQMAQQAEQGGQKDWKEYVDIDKLFPMLTPGEQDQILMALGMQPDSQGRMAMFQDQNRLKYMEIANKSAGRQTPAPAQREQASRQGVTQPAAEGERQMIFQFNIEVDASQPAKKTTYEIKKSGDDIKIDKQEQDADAGLELPEPE